MEEARVFILPTGMLNEDSCIIDEQADHIVLTLRVPKDLVRDNHAMLMALSEIAAGKSMPPIEPLPDPPDRIWRKRSPHWTYGALIFIGFLLPSPFFAYSLADYGPPIEYESVQMAKPTFKVGENIEVVFRYRRDRFCQTSFDRMVRRQIDETPIFSARIFGATTQPTNREFKDFHMVIRPPAPLPPGDYFYSGHTHSDCARGGAYDLPHPNLAFSVVD